MNRSATYRIRKRKEKQDLWREKVFNTTEIKETKCQLTNLGCLLIFMTLVYIILAFVDGLYASESLTIYDTEVDEACQTITEISGVTVEECEDTAYGADSSFSYARRVAGLRYSIIVLNGIVLFLTWLNQWVKRVPLLAIPWSQLTVVFLFAIVLYYFIIAFPNFGEDENIDDEEIYSKVRQAGPIGIIQLLIAIGCCAINILMEFNLDAEIEEQPFITFGRFETVGTKAKVKKVHVDPNSASQVEMSWKNDSQRSDLVKQNRNFLEDEPEDIVQDIETPPLDNETARVNSSGQSAKVIMQDVSESQVKNENEVKRAF